MKKYDLTQTDFSQINQLIKITSLIDDLYIKLYELEIDNKKETCEYKKIISYLNILLEKETNKYKEYNLIEAKCFAWIDYLSKNKLQKNDQIDIETILTQNYFNRVIKRILNRLYNNIESSKSYNNSLFDGLKKEMKSNGFELPNIAITHSINSSIRIRKALESDIYNLYLSLLEETISNDTFKSVKNELIKSKYNFSFINKNVESCMIINNFKINPELYIGSKMVAEIQGISLDLYVFFKDSYGIRMLTQQFVEMLKIEDIDYNNPSKLTTSILRQNLIKSILLTISDETIKDVKKEYKEIIEKDFDTLKPLSNDMSKGLINYCFENTKSTRNKLMILSLRKNN